MSQDLRTCKCGPPAIAIDDRQGLPRGWCARHVAHLARLANRKLPYERKCGSLVSSLWQCECQPHSHRRDEESGLICKYLEN